MEICLLYGRTRDLVDAALVTSAFEGGVEPGIGNLYRRFERDETGRHDEDICVVVLFHESADVFAPCKAGADALVLVQCHCHSVPGAA